ncbi:unnamed protein product [Malus baccata var. baccata]
MFGWSSKVVTATSSNLRRVLGPPKSLNGSASGHDNSVVSSDPLDESLGHSFCYIRPTPPIRRCPKSHPKSRTRQRRHSGQSPAPSSASTHSQYFRLLSASSTYTTPTAIRWRSSRAPPHSSSFLCSRFLGSSQLIVGCIRVRSKKSDIETKPKIRSLMKIIRRAILSAVIWGQKLSISLLKGGILVKESDLEKVGENQNRTYSSTNFSSHVSSSNKNEDGGSGHYSMGSQNLQWAQGKVGDDRVHVVISKEHGWVFVGIYDGFNGPDALDYLLSNLYSAFKIEIESAEINSLNTDVDSSSLKETNRAQMGNRMPDGVNEGNYALENGEMDENANSMRKQSNSLENKERPVLDRKLQHNLKYPESIDVAGVNHSDVLKALSEALRKIEDAFLDTAYKMVIENPELALMGSCVLVMLMKGDDVYLLNVGDNRAVLARNEDEPSFDSSNADESYSLKNLTALQLTMDHSTYVEEEVQRIKKEHPDDASVIMNDRVKGYLKVTRAFGAGFLKQPKWNNALLEVFRLNYVIDIYCYFTNEESVSEVKLFISSFPDGDPVQHLIEEVLFQAAKKAGMAFHELLDIPQGERRRYHDDILVIVISLEGRIWRSSV